MSAITKGAERNTTRRTPLPVRRPLSPKAWVKTARAVLETKGVDQLKIDRLARRMGVTKGSFYFHFSSRKHLLDALLADWRENNCQPFEDLDDRDDLSGPDLFEAVTDLWLEQGAFSPALDLAIRDWSRSSKAIARELAVADDARIALLAKALRHMGFAEPEALVRARISYLHQVGYFAVAFRESRADRLRYVPIYLRVLTGIETWTPREPEPRRTRSGVSERTAKILDHRPPRGER